MKPKTKLRHQAFKSRLTRHLRQWHRKLGIFAAFFLIFLSATGIALNHTNLLAMAHMPITNTLLLDHYGIKPANDIRFYQHNELFVTNNLVWFNQQLLFESAEHIIGIGHLEQFIVVVTEQQIYLYNQKAELLDQLGSTAGVPSDIQAFSLTADNIMIKTPAGYFQSNSELFDWQAVKTFVEPTWLLQNNASEQDILLANLQYRSQFLTIERIILDAHSGRIFGNFGVIFMDGIAVLLILLSLSGIYIWLRSVNNKR